MNTLLLTDKKLEQEREIFDRNSMLFADCIAKGDYIKPFSLCRWNMNKISRKVFKTLCPNAPNANDTEKAWKAYFYSIPQFVEQMKELQLKREADEAAKANEEARVKAERLVRLASDFKAGKTLSGEDFIELCKAKGVQIAARTKGAIVKSDLSLTTCYFPKSMQNSTRYSIFGVIAGLQKAFNV